jgi:hypothetical protein
VPILAGLATLAVAAPDNHGTIAATENSLNKTKVPAQCIEIIPAEFPDTKKREPPAFHGVAAVIKSGANAEAIWRNPYPQGTPEARAETLRVIEAARRGEPI